MSKRPRGMDSALGRARRLPGVTQVTEIHNSIRVRFDPARQEELLEALKALGFEINGIRVLPDIIDPKYQT